MGGCVSREEAGWKEKKTAGNAAASRRGATPPVEGIPNTVGATYESVAVREPLPSVSAWTRALTQGASQGDHNKVAQLLQERKLSSSAAGTLLPDVDCPDGEGWTPLMWAARHGYTDIVNKLLAHGARPDVVKRGESWTALMFTAQRGHEEAAKLLLNAGADVNFISGYWTPISLAARMGNVSIVKLLTKKGAKPLLAGATGWNALHHASRAGHREVVRPLMHTKCSTKEVTKDQWPALALAAHHGHTAVVNALLACPNVDVNTEHGDNDFSALMLAAHGGKVDTLLSLLEKGAKVDLQTIDGWTALMFAALFGHVEVVKLLIKAGAALSPCSYKERETALLFTCKHSCGQQHTEVAHALLSAGAAVEPRSGSEALTPLITATHYGNASIVSLLIEFGADYNKPDADGALPIMRAAFLGHEAVTKVLLREPRDFEAAKLWARKGGHLGVVDLVHTEASRRKITLEN